MSYGYRIFGVKITPKRKYDELQFDNPTFGSGGALGLLETALSDARGRGGSADDRASTYFRLDEIRSGGWVIALSAKSGGYGRSREVIETTTHTAKSPIAMDDAVMDESKFLFVIPSFGNCGVLVSLVNGRTHFTSGLARAINRELSDKGVTMRLEQDFADSVAWAQFLGQSDIDLFAVELVQNHRNGDRTSFGTNKTVAKATLSLQIAESGKANLMDRLSQARKKDKVPKLAGVLGLKGAADDDDFDEQKVVYIQDGRQRKITVNQGWPAFVYALDGDTQPTFSDLMNGCLQETKHLLGEMGVNTPQGWWPSWPDMGTI